MPARAGQGATGSRSRSKATGTKAAQASAKAKLVPRDTEDVPTITGIPVIRIGDDSDYQRHYAELFSIDDQSYNIWTNPPPGVGVKALKMAAQPRALADQAATMWVVEQLIGTEANEALLADERVTGDQLASIYSACRNIALAAAEQANAAPKSGPARRR